MSYYLSNYSLKTITTNQWVMYAKRLKYLNLITINFEYFHDISHILSNLITESFQDVLYI